jgi:nitrogen-specific signal transduction histidine kinase
LRNIPFPVCLVDAQHVLHMTNAAFRDAFTDGEDSKTRQTLDQALANFDLGTLPLEELFAPASTDDAKAGVTIEISPQAAGGETHYYYVTTFSIRHIDPST